VEKLRVFGQRVAPPEVPPTRVSFGRVAKCIEWQLPPSLKRDSELGVWSRGRQLPWQSGRISRVALQSVVSWSRGAVPLPF